MVGGVALERAVPVAELRPWRRPCGDLACGTVQHPQPCDRPRDLLSVRPDVLDRGGAHTAGDPGQRLDPTTAFGDHGGHELVPDSARRDDELVTVLLPTGGAHEEHRFGHAVVSGNNVAATSKNAGIGVFA